MLGRAAGAQHPGANDFVSEILDEMTGLGPLEPLLKDETVNES